jgi:hypothetical protein
VPRFAAAVALFALLVGSASASRDAYRRYTISTASISLLVPASWNTLSASVPRQRQALNGLSSGALFAAYDPNGSGANFVVLLLSSGAQAVEESDLTASFARLVLIEMVQVEQRNGYTVSSKRVAVVRISGMKALRIQLVMKKKGDTGFVAQTQYLFPRGSRLLDIAYSSSAVMLKKYSPVFSTSIHSLRFTK